MQKRVYLIGPSVSLSSEDGMRIQCTGKSTTCRELVQRLGLSGPAVVKEVARDVMVRDGFTREHVGSLQMQLAIMQAHLKKERDGDELPLQVCDRSAVDPLVYAVLQAPNATEGRIRFNYLVGLPEFQEVLPLYRRSVFVLFALVPEWLTDDGIRSLDKHPECFDLFKKILGELEIPFEILGPEKTLLEERVNHIIRMLGTSVDSHL